MINRAFNALNRRLGLVLVPALTDLVSFVFGLLTVGFWGASKFTFKLVLDAGLPSISTIIEHNVFAGSVNFDFAGSGPDTMALALALLLFVLGAFAEAGFIGLLYERAKGNAVNLDTFLSYASRFWLRFLGLRALMFLVTLAGLVMAMLLSFLGMIAYLVVFMVLRVKYIYWEFTIVADDLGVFEAFARSAAYFDNRTPELSGVIIGILVANFIFALLVNFLWHPLPLLLFIPIYCYVASGMQLALMMSLPGCETA